MSRVVIETRTKGLPEGGSKASYLTYTSTGLAERTVLSLTSDAGYSDVYTDVYSGPSSVATPGRYVVIVPPGDIRVSASSTEWGVPVSGVSAFATPSSVLYLSTTGSTGVDGVTVLAF